jgi:hypothetical protein
MLPCAAMLCALSSMPAPVHAQGASADCRSTAHGNQQLKGVYNFCNPGAISHNQVLQIYKEEVDPDFTWENFSIEEQAKVLAAGRSNNFLDTSKLEAAAKQLGMRLPDIHTATREAMAGARASLEAQGTLLPPHPSAYSLPIPLPCPPPSPISLPCCLPIPLPCSLPISNISTSPPLGTTAFPCRARARAW